MTLPSIAAAYKIAAILLPSDIRDRREVTDIIIDQKPEKIPTHGPASLTAEQTSHNREGTTTIKIRTEKPIDTTQPTAIIIKTHEGRLLLIGAAEPPFPQIRQTAATGSNPKETAATDIQIDWSDLPIPVTILTE